MSEEQPSEVVYNQFKRTVVTFGVPLSEPNRSQVEKFQARLERSPSLKAIFWKDQLVYHQLVHLAECCLHRPCAAKKQRRTTDLQSAHLLLQTLVAAMRDSDCISEKLQMFQHNKGRVMHNLLRVLLTPPEMQHHHNAMCTRMLNNHQRFASDAWKNLPEGYLIGLLAEVSHAVTALLYQLVNTADLLFKNHMTTSLFDQLVDELPLDFYVQRSISLTLGLISKSSQEQLQPSQTVLIYKHFFVLKYLMENVHQVLEYVLHNYEEEVKYYMKWELLGPKIPDHYAVKPLVKSAVERVTLLALSS